MRIICYYLFTQHLNIKLTNEEYLAHTSNKDMNKTSLKLMEMAKPFASDEEEILDFMLVDDIEEALANPITTVSNDPSVQPIKTSTSSQTPLKKKKSKSPSSKSAAPSSVDVPPQNQYQRK